LAVSTDYVFPATDGFAEVKGGGDAKIGRIVNCSDELELVGEVRGFGARGFLSIRCDVTVRGGEGSMDEVLVAEGDLVDTLGSPSNC